MSEMSTLYLHIGTPKTGTTAIQHFLASNKRILQSKGYIFPNFEMRFENVPPKRNAHFLIDKVYNKEADTLDYKTQINQCYESIYTALETYENVILTDEAIWHACIKIDNFWEDLNERIISRGHQLKLIVYLRRQDEFIQSYWKYKVLEKETGAFMKYVNSKKYAFFPLNYHTHLTSIAEKIGKDNIIIRVYEKGQYKGANKTIISDFLYTIGLEFTDEYKLEENLQNTNVDFICTEIKRRLNSIPEFWDKRGYIRGYMTEVSEQYKSEGKYQFKSLFNPEEQDLFLQKYEEENRKIATEWLGRADGKLFYNPVLYDENEKKFSTMDYVKTCGVIFSLMEQDIEELKLEKEMLEEEVKLLGHKLSLKKSFKWLRNILNHVVPNKYKKTKIWKTLQEKTNS